MRISLDVDAFGLEDKLWAGGQAWFNNLVCRGASYQALYDVVLEYLGGGEEDPVIDITTINDFFWFKHATIAEALGLPKEDE